MVFDMEGPLALPAPLGFLLQDRWGGTPAMKAEGLQKGLQQAFG
jgi:hypothetical protein